MTQVTEIPSPAAVDTLAVLRWARSRRHEEPLASFWSALCVKLGEPQDASAERVLAELGANGGNSFANFFRGEGVVYAEVAYDVARGLAGLFGDKPFSRGDVEGCERFVLRKLGITEDDLARLCATVDRRALARAVEKQVEQRLGQAAAATVGNLAAREAAKRAAQEAGLVAARRVAAEVGKRIAGQLLTRLLFAFNAVMVAWLVVDLAGPALRKTIPGVTYVALLRKLHEAATEEEG